MSTLLMGGVRPSKKSVMMLMMASAGVPVEKIGHDLKDARVTQRLNLCLGFEFVCSAKLIGSIMLRVLGGWNRGLIGVPGVHQRMGSLHHGMTKEQPSASTALHVSPPTTRPPWPTYSETQSAACRTVTN